MKAINIKEECENGDVDANDSTNQSEKDDGENTRIKKEGDIDQVDGSNGNVKSTSKLDEGDEKMELNDDDESKQDVTMTEDDIKSEPNAVKQMSNGRQKMLFRTKLTKIIEKLITKVSEQPANQVPTQIGPGFHLSSTTRSNDLYYHQQHVSPRKRILREFEKVSLEETSNLTTQKRSRSKSNASADFSTANNHSKGAGTYATGVTQHISTIGTATNNSKGELSRIANGNQSPHKNANSMDSFASEKSFKSTKASTASTNSQTIASNEAPAPQPTAKPISSYSIISLLGHNSSGSENKNENSNAKEKNASDARRSPKSPSSYSQQSFSASRSAMLTSKKKSPTNSSNSSIQSPINYRNAQSPDVNSPSPDHYASRNHPQRYQHNSASISSPSSGFHPYLSSSRASPISSGTLSPTDYRHRSTHVYGKSFSVTSDSTSSPSSHAYASLNGSPTSYRYSPSTYNSMQTSPPQSTHNLSSAYNISNLLPQTYDANNVSRNSNSISHSFSPNSKPRTSDWSPARNSVSSTTATSATTPTPTTISQSHPNTGTNSGSSISTTTIPKKTASIRQKYGSLSPSNVMNVASNSERSISPSPKNDASSTRKPVNDYSMEMKSKRSRSPTDSDKKFQQQQQQQYEKDIQARYNAELAAHQHSLMASALHSQRQNPFYGIYPGGAPPPLINSSVSQSMAAAAAAAYLNPLYYHPLTYDNMMKNPMPPWMYPNAAGAPFAPEKNALNQLRKSVENASKEYSPRQDRPEYDPNRLLLSPYGIPSGGGNLPPTTNVASTTSPWIDPYNSSVSSVPSAFQRRSHQFNDNEPISLTKDEPSSGNLTISKHLWLSQPFNGVFWFWF